MKIKKHKLRRNAPCPCGDSCKKYKNCCLHTTKSQNTPVTDPGTIPNLFKIAMAHHQNGHLQDADVIYQQILLLEPNNHNAYHLLGLIARQFGKLDIAIELITKAISIHPTAPMYYNLGIVLHEQGHQQKAIECYQSAIEMHSAYSEAYANLGALLQTQGKIDAAIGIYRNGLSQKPDDVELHVNLGVAFQAKGNEIAAIKSLNKALEINPNHPAANNNLGNILTNQCHLVLAQEKIRKAIAISPKYAEAHSNLGIALATQGLHEEAVKSFQLALSCFPNFDAAKWNESMSLLSLGRLAEGWEKYQYRLLQASQVQPGREFTQSEYDGQDISDKTVLIWAEQGIGDEILFSGVLPHIIKDARHCIIECEEKLIDLFTRSFPEAEVIPKSTPPSVRTLGTDIDYQCPIGSLPRWYRKDISEFPNHNGYLKADETRTEFWKRRLDKLDKNFKVGISWRSMNINSVRGLYYTKLTQWQDILTLPGVTFVNLQYDNVHDEIEEVKKLYGTKIHTWNDIDLLNNLDDAAALTTALDLVLAPTTSVLEMAGALGKESWNLSHVAGILSLGTNYLPWFPNSRLFRKPFDESWEPLLNIVSLELNKFCQNKTKQTG